MGKAKKTSYNRILINLVNNLPRGEETITNYIPKKYLDKLTNFESITYHKLCLTKIKNSNDDFEKQNLCELSNISPDKIFTLSYTIDSTESIPMWLMYGGKELDKKMAYSIKSKKLENSIKKENYIVYYDCKSNGETKLEKLEKTDYDIILTKIMYEADKNEQMDTSLDDKIIIGTSEYIVNVKEIKEESKKHKELKKNLIGRIKKMAWKSERELRLLIHLKNKYINPEHLFVSINDDSLFKDMTILISPWNTDYDLLEPNTKRSIFTNSLDSILPSGKCKKCESRAA